MDHFSLDFLKQKKVFLLLIWCVVLFGFGTGNIANPNLWFDESLQLWASRGQYHYNNYDTELPNTFASALQSNYRNTWDPPGFTLALHLLGKITSQAWIFRTLSLLFFVLSCLILTMLAKKWTPQCAFSSVAGLLLFLSPLLCYYALEIRPYTMELMHAILAAYLVCCCDDRWSKKKCFFFGLALAISMASRYPSVFPAVLCATFIAGKFFYQPESPNFILFDKEKMRRYLCLFLPSFVLGLQLIVLMASKTWSFATQNDAYHLHFLIFSDPSEVFNWTTLFLWLPLIILLLLRFSPSKVISEICKKYDLYIGFVLSLNILRLLVDLAHFMPYSLIFRFNLPCHALLLFCWVPLLLLAYEYCALRQIKNIVLATTPSIISIAIVCAIIANSLLFTRQDPDPSIGYLSKLPIEPTPKILTAIEIYPTLRYAFEFGALNDRPHWKEKVYFYGKKYPDVKNWIVQDKFEFLASGEMNEVYYHLAQQKNYDLIVESCYFVQTGKKKRFGMSTKIVTLR